MLEWSYGVTTVPSRKESLLSTFDSLRNAGFPHPRTFMDGGVSEAFCPRITYRSPPVNIYGNWLLGMMELYIRNPKADRYAMFQDDIECCIGLKDYLDSCSYPEFGYWNLYTAQENERIIRDKPQGWYESAETLDAKQYLHGKSQTGRGAIALVFNRETLCILLQHSHMIQRIHQDDKKGWRNIDGAVVTAMNQLGYREYIHNPSLVQHVGLESTHRNRVLPTAKSYTGKATL